MILLAFVAAFTVALLVARARLAETGCTCHRIEAETGASSLGAWP